MLLRLKGSGSSTPLSLSSGQAPSGRWHWTRTACPAPALIEDLELLSAAVVLATEIGFPCAFCSIDIGGRLAKVLGKAVLRFGQGMETAQEETESMKEKNQKRATAAAALMPCKQDPQIHGIRICFPSPGPNDFIRNP